MKTLTATIIAFSLLANFAKAQEQMYIYSAGKILFQQAINNIDSITFSKSTQDAETVTDIDGNVYHTVTIGTQTWMVENLKTTKYHNGDGGVIPNVKGNEWGLLKTGAYRNYNDDDENGLKYGRLYNWYAVNDSRKLAPYGWHIASDAEWTKLINYLIANGFNYDGSKNDNRAAKSIASIEEWISSSAVGAIGNTASKNNSSGFNALPGGSDYGDYGKSTCWWTSTKMDIYNYFAYCRSLEFNSSYIFRSSLRQNLGMYVRCVKD